MHLTKISYKFDYWTLKFLQAIFHLNYVPSTTAFCFSYILSRCSFFFAAILFNQVAEKYKLKDNPCLKILQDINFTSTDLFHKKASFLYAFRVFFIDDNCNFCCFWDWKFLTRSPCGSFVMKLPNFHIFLPKILMFLWITLKRT